MKSHLNNSNNQMRQMRKAITLWYLAVVWLAETFILRHVKCSMRRKSIY